MRGNPNILQSTAFVEQPSHPSVALTNTVGISLAITLPILLCLAFAYRKHRAKILQQRIKLLNQIWQLESRQKQS